MRIVFFNTSYMNFYKGTIKPPNQFEQSHTNLVK